MGTLNGSQMRAETHREEQTEVLTVQADRKAKWAARKPPQASGSAERAAAAGAALGAVPHQAVASPGAAATGPHLQRQQPPADPCLLHPGLPPLRPPRKVPLTRKWISTWI